MTRLAPLLLAGACATAPRPRPASPAPAPAPEPPVPAEQQLTAELRARAPDVLPAYATGPIVVLDLDTGTFTTLCGDAAAAAAREWGALLVDPSREKLRCFAAPDRLYNCTQPVGERVLLIDFVGPPWRIQSVVIGDPMSKGARTNVASLREHVASALCP